MVIDQLKLFSFAPIICISSDGDLNVNSLTEEDKINVVANVRKLIFPNDEAVCDSYFMIKRE
jgi:hypothetical protein